MILNISSPNKHLADLLFKNPTTDEGLYFKALRNGIIAGNLVSPNEYQVIFQDTQNSYLPEESNTLDFQSYCSPLAILNICTELFAHILKDKASFAQQDISWLNTTQGAADKHPCTITVPTFYIHSSWYRDGVYLLSRYFSGVQVVKEKGRNFSLHISGSSVFEAFNLLALVALFTHMTNEYGLFTYIDDSFAEKYVRILTNLEHVPYFVFYLYIKRTVKSYKQFQLVKPVMEAYLSAEALDAELTFYGTQQDRMQFITDRLDVQTAILDIGCGEFGYYKKMMNKGLQAAYYAVDEEARFEKLGAAIAQRYEAENLHFYTNLGDAQVKEQVNIIMSEVIEHNSLEAARSLVQQALTFPFRQILITTPNADFNRFYFDDTHFRHDDHQFELTAHEFEAFIASCLPADKPATVEFAQVGDKLNNIRPTQVCIIKPAQHIVP